MKKILVRVPQWLGDAVLSTIFIARLKSLQPESQISVLCPAFMRPIFEKHPAVHEAIGLPYKERNIFFLGKILREKSFDEAYILPKSFRTALEAWLGKIPSRIGFSGDMQRFLLTETHRRQDHKGFDPYRYLKLLGEKTLQDKNIFSFFPKDQPAHDIVESLLGKPLKDIKRPILGIAPKSVAPARTWDTENFALTAQRFQKENNGTIFLFGIESERAATSLVKSVLKENVVDFTGKLNMPEGTGLLGWAMSLCDYFLCNDSGLMHIAIALGVPTLAVYGSGDPDYAGYNKRAPFKAIQHREIFCVPCLRNHCVRFGSSYNECLKAITVIEVLSQLNQLSASPVG